MSFILQILIAFVILLAGLAYSILVPPDGSSVHDWVYGIGSLAAQTYLFAAALLLRGRVKHFDMLVASEVIVAFGVMSLVLGVANSLLLILLEKVKITELSVVALKPAVLPFVEGLAAAGWAPLLSTILRQVEVLSPRSEGETEDLKHEFDSLREKVRDLTTSVQNLLTAFERSQSVFEESAASFGHSGTVYKASATTVEAALHSLATAAQTDSTALATAIRSLTTAFADSAGKVQTTAQDFSALSVEAQRFRKEAQAGATLLHDLQTLILEVNRFIHRDKA